MAFGEKASDFLPDRWSLQYIALLVYTFGMVTGRLPVGTAAAIFGLGALILFRPGLRGGAPIYWMAAFLVWAGVGYFFSDHQGIVSETLTEMAKLLLVSTLVIGAIGTYRQALFFMIFVMLCFIAYPVRGTLTNYFVYNYTQFGRAVAGGIYDNSNDLAALTLLQLSVALSLFASAKHTAIKYLSLIFAVSMALTIVLTQSRGVFLGTLAFLGIIVLSGKKKLRTMLGIVIAMIAFTAVVPDSVFERFNQFTETIIESKNIDEADPEGSAEGRSDIYRIALEISSDHLLLGVGIGAYPWVHENYALQMDSISETARRRIDAHSSYLTVLAENGVVGLLLFLAMIYSALRPAIVGQENRHYVPRPLALQMRLLAAGYVGFLVAAVVGTYTSMSMTYVHLVGVWALAKAVTTESCNRQETHD